MTTAELTNTDRANRAFYAIAHRIHATGADTDDAVTDLLADLMHFCNQCGIDFDDQLSRATDHYAEEREYDPA